MNLLPAFCASPRADVSALENRILCADALELLRQLPDSSVDLIATDPPYNTTACEFESDIALQDSLWSQIWRVMKPNRAVIMTGSQPFTTHLIYRNLKQYRHSWVWEKSLATGYLNANRQPMKAHEDVIVFGNGAVDYYPQMAQGKAYRATRGAVGGHVQDKTVGGYVTKNTGSRYPRTVLRFASAKNPVHPTEKPIGLMRYLIETYSNAGDLILDFFCGAGTTLDAARQTGRRFIGCDNDNQWIVYSHKRLERAYTLSLFAQLETA